MIKCPVCGLYDFKRFSDGDVCDFCGWENDCVQNEDPDYRGGANPDSLNERRAWWNEQQRLKAQPA
jgi:uncharacterized Zn finger protein (UPF0148 family)